MNKFWNGKKVLVTGHTGFVGTWLCIVLKYQGAVVSGFSLREENESLYNRVKKELNIKNYYGDLCNISDIERCISETQPEIVYHLAAYGFIKECFDNPERAYNTNIIGTFHLLEAIRKYPCIKYVVAASSDKVYRNDDNKIEYFNEDASLGGIDPYSCSKTAEDMMIQAHYETYFKSKNITLSILRPSNILGGGDHNTMRLIPYIINQLITGRKLVIRNPKAVRPWQSILDMTDAYLQVVQSHYKKNGLYIYNVGPHKENITTVEGLVHILLEFCPKAAPYQLDIPNHSEKEIEHRFLGLSIQKIQSELGWQPKKDIRDILYDVYSFETQKKEIGEYNLCKKQIKNYYQKEG